jgi:acyl-CoA thioesterase-1
MGDDDESRPRFGAARQDEVDNRFAGGGVQIASGFIGKQQRRARGQSAGDGHTLLLAARQLAGVMVEPVAKADRLQFLRRAQPRIRHPGQFERGHHIFQRRHRGQQVKRLQHHPDPPAPGHGQAVLGQGRKILPSHHQAAPAGAFKARQHRHQAGFAAARGAKDRQHLPLWHGEIDAFENGGGAIARAQGEGERASGKGGLVIWGLGHDTGMVIAPTFGKGLDQGLEDDMAFWVRVTGMAMIAALGACKPAPQTVPAKQEMAAPKGPVVRIVALGDSLLAGYGLSPAEAYPARLQEALRARGLNAQVVNAGVSGDTTADGLARLDFTLGGQSVAPDLVILSLGGNDMLRGLPLAQTRDNLDAILARLTQKKIKVVVMGMLAAPNMGPDYAAQFNAIFPSLAKKHGAVLEPFFLRAIFGHAELQLPDHIHPTAKGVDAMVAATVDKVAGALPQVEPN